MQGAERYLSERKLPRAPYKPENSITVQAALDILPYGKWKVYKAIFSGEIEAVIHSQTIYLDQESVEAYRLEQKSLLPLPGWILVRDAARQVHRSYSSIKAWLTLHDKPIRVFMHPTLNRPCQYMREKDLEAYKRLAKQTDKHVPKRFRPR